MEIHINGNSWISSNISISMYYKKRSLYLVTEKLGKSLYHAFIKKKFPLSITGVQTIVFDIIICLINLKEHGIIHCDLKPENILLIKNESNHVKVIDFGSALFINDTVICREIQTLPYRAPEIILGAKYGYPIDMWSLGCIIYELITNQVLFQSPSVKKNFVKALVINNQQDLSCFGKINKSFFEDGFTILGSDAEFDKQQVHVVMPKFDYDFDNELIQRCQEPILVDFVKKCLILDPKKRMTSEEAKVHPFLKKMFKNNIFKQCEVF